MAKYEENRPSKSLIAFIVTIIIAALVVGGYFLLKNKDIVTTGGTDTPTFSKLNETITSENYEELTGSIAQELGDNDDLYYFSYATTYYICFLI